MSSLPFENGRFDWASAFETIYFWPGLEKCLAEVRRVLKDGGGFLIYNESNGEDAMSKKMPSKIPDMKLYTAEEIEASLKRAGFSEVRTFKHDNNVWTCVVARK